jgi:hypothetical protein
MPARKMARRLVSGLREYAEQLGCAEELESVRSLIGKPTWAERQLAILQETGDPTEVVRRMISAAAPAGATAAR